MPLTRAKKTEKLNMLASELEHSTSAIIGTFKALTASKDFDLRKTVREAGGSYHVVKNKLAARASKGTQVEAALQGLKGVSSVAYTSGDPVALAKALSAWVKDNAEFTFKLGIVDGKVISVEDISALATMPGKEELFSKLLFLIQSPAQRLATVINASGRDLAVVLNMAAEQGKFAAGPVPVTAASAKPADEAKPAPVAEAQVAPVAEPVAAAAAPVVEAPVPEVAPAPVAEVASAEASAAAVVGGEPEAPVAPAPEAGAEVEAAHVEESTAGEQPSGAAQPENSTASQAGEAAASDPAEGA
jgi:large subunit ribosomal protein L10